MPSVVSFFGVEPIRIGGTETYARELSEQLGKHGWDSILCFLTPPSDELRRFLDLPNVSLEILDETSVRASLRSVRKVARLLRRYRPDILHLHYTGFLGPYPWLGQLLGVDRVFFTDHSSRPAEHIQQRAPTWKRQLARMINWPLAKVICVSNYGYRCSAARDLFPLNKHEMIYNGVDLTRALPSEQRAQEFRRSFSIPEQRKIVLQVSWIIPEKGISDLLSAAQLVLARNADVQFVLVGEGAYRQEYMQQAREMGLKDNITWTGLLHDPFGEGVYDAADVVCQVSRWEEVFGWVIAEAMAYRKPVIGTRVGGIPELVVDSESGYLLPRGDVNKLAEKILTLVSDQELRSRLGEFGQRVAYEKFDLRKNISRLVQAYGIQDGRAPSAALAEMSTPSAMPPNWASALAENNNGLSGPEVTIKTEVFIGPEASRLINEASFQQRWRTLSASCPWGTVFQDPEFVMTWFAAYESRFGPLIVTGTDAEGNLLGLLTLAQSKDGKELVLAGSILAEYQTWLAEPRYGNLFIEEALKELSRRFPNQSLRFLFVPPGTPSAWMERGRFWADRCRARRLARPLTAIGNGELFRETLAKKRYKKRLNKLKDSGDLRFERLTNSEELEAVYDEIVSYGALRLGALHNVFGAQEPDSLKKSLNLNLMRLPGLLHATVLRLDGKIISAQINVRNREQVLLGFLSHSPFFAKYSPGKLHLLLLGELLAEEGVSTLDLTAGDSDYKEWLATHHDDVQVFQVFFKRTDYLQHRLQRFLLSSATSTLKTFGMPGMDALDSMGHLKEKIGNLKLSSLPRKMLGRTKRALWHTREMRIYEYEVAAAPPPKSQQQLMNRDYVSDLLAFKPSESWQPPVNSFLREALASLEDGAHAYTYVENGRLLHYGWLIERQETSVLDEVGQVLRLPPDSAVLTNYYTDPTARGRGLYRTSLAQMLDDAAAIPGTKHIFICVLADNAPSRHVIEKAGFSYRFSFFRKNTLGQSRCWSNAPEEFIGNRAATE